MTAVRQHSTSPGGQRVAAAPARLKQRPSNESSSSCSNERHREWHAVRMSDQPVFDQINVVVRDMPAMLEFYGLLGLDVAGSDPGWEQHHRKATASGGFDLDFDSQAFAQQWNHGWP